MKKLLFFVLSLLLFFSCSKENSLQEKPLLDEFSQIAFLAEQADIINAIKTTNKILHSINEVLLEESNSSYKKIELLKDFKGDNLNDQEMKEIISLFGLKNKNEFEDYLLSLQLITNKYPILVEDEVISIKVYNLISNTGHTKIRNCEDVCWTGYWARGLGCAGIGGACLPCGITCAIANAGILLDCIDDC